MSRVAIQGDPNGIGTFTIAAPNSNNNRTINLPDIGGGQFVVTDASGNVGIGLTSLIYKFEVDGSAQLRSTNAVLFLGSPTGSFGSTSAIGRASTNGFHVADSTAGDLCIGAESGRGILFGTHPSGSLAPRMKIEANGQQVSCIPAFSNSTLYPEFKCRAWVNFDGTTSTPSIRGSGNVSSVARNSTGVYTINLSTAMPDANGAVVKSDGRNSINGADFSISSGSFTFSTRDGSFAAQNTGLVCASLFR